MKFPFKKFSFLFNILVISAFGEASEAQQFLICATPKFAVVGVSYSPHIAKQKSTELIKSSVIYQTEKNDETLLQQALKQQKSINSNYNHPQKNGAKRLNALNVIQNESHVNDSLKNDLQALLVNQEFSKIQKLQNINKNVVKLVISESKNYVTENLISFIAENNAQGIELLKIAIRAGWKKTDLEKLINHIPDYDSEWYSPVTDEIENILVTAIQSDNIGALELFLQKQISTEDVTKAINSSLLEMSKTAPPQKISAIVSAFTHSGSTISPNENFTFVHGAKVINNNNSKYKTEQNKRLIDIKVLQKDWPHLVFNPNKTCDNASKFISPTEYKTVKSKHNLSEVEVTNLFKATIPKSHIQLYIELLRINQSHLNVQANPIEVPFSDLMAALASEHWTKAENLYVNCNSINCKYAIIKTIVDMSAINFEKLIINHAKKDHRLIHDLLIARSEYLLDLLRSNGIAIDIIDSNGKGSQFWILNSSIENLDLIAKYKLNKNEDSFGLQTNSILAGYFQ
ncbi:hypothetical protein [Planctobacterium marinum]|uniref:Uncharacterized protein n=1 Tax=Planctobacterium marinum TaxID=1631968 RepID=A0AA48KTP4_9ALTE|nr:hypothetical protein MACH26_39230 [Planctobacterium marinum]